MIGIGILSRSDRVESATIEKVSSCAIADRPMPYSKFTLVVSIYLTDYPLVPVDNVLGVLVWMLRNIYLSL
jgi:hypothetical protein